jgi:Ca2+-binding RTX toxin-like protein
MPTVYNWSELDLITVFGGGGANPPSFNPSFDTLHIDDPSISAAIIGFGIAGGTLSIFEFGSKTVTLDTPPYTLTAGNIIFADGSTLWYGDNSVTGPATDDADNVIVTGNGNDLLAGAGGNDQLFGGLGNDVLVARWHSITNLYGDDTFNGGAGKDFVDYADSNSSVTVHLGNETTPGFSVGGDGSPGTTLILDGIEGVFGTEFADTLNANSATQVSGRVNTDIVQIFEGFGGNDTINGATGDGRLTVLSYQFSDFAVNVDLNSGNASDGNGGFDTVNNIDGVIGSAFNDFISGSTFDDTASEVFHFFEGMAGNDVLNGSRFVYDHSPRQVVVNLSESAISGDFYGTGVITVNSNTARDGWDSLGGGTDALNGIDARGSKFNDTIIGSDEEDNWFEGGGGNDYIDGRGGIDDHEDTVEYLHATGGVYVNFALGTAQGIGGADNGVGVDTLLNVEGVRGSDFADSLVGGGVGALSLYHVEAFEGRAGDDTLNGGDADPLSLDIASYELSPSSVIVNLSDATINALGFDVAARTARDGYGIGGHPTGIDVLVNLNSATGSVFDDYLMGSSGDNWLQGLAGNDTIIGGAGIDTLICDTPDDLLDGVIVNLATGIVTDAQGDIDMVSGIEIVWGTFEADNITGDGNNNEFDGAEGDDTINGGGGSDTALYELEQAHVNLATGVALDGFGHTDTLISIENLVGSEFDDFFKGNAAANLLEGGAGNDTLDGGGGPDTMIGGAGDDTYIVNHAGDRVIEAAGGGNDTVITSVSMALPANVENILFTGGAGIIISGNAQANIIGGGASNDTLSGGAGIDTVSYALANKSVTINLETGTATGYGNDVLSGFENAIGGTKADTLIGNSGKNVLDGSGGADRMTGGIGGDTYIVDNVDDKVIETSNSTSVGALLLPGDPGPALAGAGAVADTVIAAVTYSLAKLQFVENLTLTSSAARATGNVLANKLTGNEGNNILDGKDGNDTLDGKAGSDRLLGGKGNDTLVWGEGDTIDGGAGTDKLKVSDSLDLVSLANDALRGIETIDMNGGGNDILTLNQQDVLDLSISTDTLTVLGNAGDVVNAAGFIQGAESGSFRTYTSGMATLLVESDVTVNI